MNVRLFPMFAPPMEPAVHVSSRRFVIGRAADCDLRIDSPIVSRRHCELIVEDDKVRVHDLESSNGTYVNKQPVAGIVELNDGDLLAVAMNVYKVEIQASGSGIRLLAQFGRFVGAAAQ